MRLNQRKQQHRSGSAYSMRNLGAANARVAIPLKVTCTRFSHSGPTSVTLARHIYFNGSGDWTDEEAHTASTGCLFSLTYIPY